jgi:hypothetical protein
LFCADAGGAVQSVQAGVIRTNCLDCLDRTNMAQATLAAAVAAEQLAALSAAAAASMTAKAAAAGMPARAAAAPAPSEAAGADGAGPDAPQPPPPPPLSAAQAATLARLWEAHGDALSRQYTLTPAQRRDRSAPLSAESLAAALRDCGIAVLRYLHNNHSDGPACDAAALVSGAHVPPRARDAAAPPPPLPRAATTRAAHAARRLPLLQAAALLCAGRALAALRALWALSGDLIGASSAFVVWISVLVALAHVATHHGARFVARPLLAPPAPADSLAAR